MWLVVAWLVSTGITIWLGFSKDRPVLGVVLAFLFPFASLVAMVMVPAKDLGGVRWPRQPDHFRECPWCHARIPFDAKMCGKCFQRVPPPGEWMGVHPPPPADPGWELPPPPKR
jgi:hypothetical protein